jgi:parvulin-like peptidyl-prolyl isomerase
VKRFLLIALVGGLTVAAQSTAEVAPDAVVAVINGKNYTAQEIRNIVAASPVPQAKVMFQRNPADFLKAQAVLQAYADVATKAGLEKQTPTKEQLEFYRLYVLSNAALSWERTQIDVSTQIEVSPDEQQAWYKNHPDEFREARVRMIYFPFSDGLSEAAAKSKAESVAKEARSGSDFVKLAKANAVEDSASAGAEFPVRADSQQPPPEMKKVLMASTAGTVTDPLRHTNGYYIFRVESIEQLPYDKVKDEVFKKLSDARFRAWQNDVQSNVSVQIKNDAFFKNSAQQ